MATAPKSSPTEEARALVECPVCVSIFRNPKSLRCGHSVCSECCQQLRTAVHVVCPVCRTRTMVPAEGLPTNFALQDLVEHHMTHQTDRKQVCGGCQRRFSIDDSWICSLCNTGLICANCAIKDHRGHELQMISEIINHRREMLTEWRQRMDGSIREVDARRRQIDANVARLEQRSMQFNSLLRTKVEPRFASCIQDLNNERDQLFADIHEVDVSDIIGGSNGDDATQAASHFENQLNEVTPKLDALKTKQEQILADQRLALELIQNSTEVLRQMCATASPTQKSTAADNRPPRAQEVTCPILAAAYAATPPRMGNTFASRRGRIFPCLFGEDRRSNMATASAAAASSESQSPPENIVLADRVMSIFGEDPDEAEIPPVHSTSRSQERQESNYGNPLDRRSHSRRTLPSTAYYGSGVERQMARAQEDRALVDRARTRAAPVGWVETPARYVMTSDDEAEQFMAVQLPPAGVGRGMPCRRSGARPPSMSVGRGRSQDGQQGASSMVRSEDDFVSTRPVGVFAERARARAMEEQQKAQQQISTDGQQQANNVAVDEAGSSASASTSNAPPARSTPSPGVSSDEDDVAEPITFHTFLQTGSNPNDKSQH